MLRITANAIWTDRRVVSCGRWSVFVNGRDGDQLVLMRLQGAFPPKTWTFHIPRLDWRGRVARLLRAAARALED